MADAKPTVTIIGCGYVGLTLAAVLANAGINVYALEMNPKRLAAIKEGRSFFYELGADPLIAAGVKSGKLIPTDSYERSIPQSSIVFSCVGTPDNPDGSSNLSYVFDAATAALKLMKPGAIFVQKSTVPVGTGAKIEQLIAGSRKKIPYVSCPEFSREATAIVDTLWFDRAITGSADREAAQKVLDLHKHIEHERESIARTAGLKAPDPLPKSQYMIVSRNSAELIKVSANAFLALKISFANSIAKLADTAHADITEVMDGVGSDRRIGRAFLNAGRGYGGGCFDADETVFSLNSPDIAAECLNLAFTKAGGPKGTGYAVVKPADQRVLAFDMVRGQPTLAIVTAMTRRPYTGTMVTVRTSMGRMMRVTADHPIVVHNEHGFSIVPAASITAGDRLALLCSLPAIVQATQLNLIELLRGTDLERDVYVKPVDTSFVEQYAQFAQVIPNGMLKYPREIKEHNRMSLRLFRYLQEVGALHVPAEKLQLYTARTLINAVIPVDKDLLRLCGYYASEGCIATDVGRAGAIRHRISFSFHEQERDYIADVQRILGGWGLAFTERHRTTTHCSETVVSSRILAWLLRDLLRCGTNSGNKALPKLAYNVAPDLRMEVIRGAFSGGGAATTVWQGKNPILEYATVSKRLADGMMLLLQTIGIITSLRMRRMNKATRDAFILRVGGYDQLEMLKNACGDKRFAQISQIPTGYARHIKPHGYERHESFATVAVRSVEYEQVDTSVYSMETTTGTLITASGLVSHNCFPKDVSGLIRSAEDCGVEMEIMHAATEVNESMPHYVIAKAKLALGGTKENGVLCGKRVAVLGLSFKAGTSDVRRSAAVVIANTFAGQGAQVRVYDPEAMDEARPHLDTEIKLAENIESAITRTDCIVVATDWPEFISMDIGHVAKLSGAKVFVDCMNRFDASRFAGTGMQHIGIGRD